MSWSRGSSGRFFTGGGGEENEPEGVARLAHQPQSARVVPDPYVARMLAPNLEDRFRISNDVDETIVVRTNELQKRLLTKAVSTKT